MKTLDMFGHIHEASMVIQEAENQFRIYYKKMDKNGIEYYDN